jgi:hypothetical protein
VESLGSSGTGKRASEGRADRRASASEPSEGAPDPPRAALAGSVEPWGASGAKAGFWPC